MSVMCAMCSEENTDTAKFCVNCGADISLDNADICDNPSMRKSDIPTSVLSLYEVRHKVEITVKQDGIVGRLGDIEREFFANSPYVSEHHCRLYFESGHWYVEHLSFTNPTAINSVNIEQDMPNVLRDGDRLRIADLYFKVSAGTVECDDNPDEAVSGKENESAEAEKTREIWEIICPICGKIYTNDTEFRVSECTSQCRADEFDKVAISKVLPRKRRA